MNIFPPYIIKVKRIPWGDYDGWAAWPFILMTDPTDLKLLYHEKYHHKQQIRGLFIGFLIKYIYYHFKYGHRNNPYEVEAREKADEAFSKVKVVR